MKYDIESILFYYILSIITNTSILWSWKCLSKWEHLPCILMKNKTYTVDNKDQIGDSGFKPTQDATKSIYSSDFCLDASLPGGIDCRSVSNVASRQVHHWSRFVSGSLSNLVYNMGRSSVIDAICVIIANLLNITKDENRQKVLSSTTPTVFWRPSPKNPREYPHVPDISRHYTVSQKNCASVIFWITPWNIGRL